MNYNNIRIENVRVSQDSGSFIIRYEELKKLGLKKEHLEDPFCTAFQQFYSMMCNFVNKAFIRQSCDSYVCTVVVLSNNDVQIEYEKIDPSAVQEMMELLGDDFDSISLGEDDDYCYEDCPYYDDTLADLEEDSSGDIGLVETYSFAECIRFIDNLKALYNKSFEIINLNDVYYINVSECKLSGDILSELGAGEVHTERYVCMVRASAQEHGGSIFNY